MTCAQIAPRAAGLSALPPEDAERRAAFDHARTCVSCRRALDEGLALWDLLELAPPEVAPGPVWLPRTDNVVRSELRVVRWHRLARPIALGAAVMAIWVVALHGGRRLVGAERASTSAVLATLAVFATSAAVSAWGPAVATLPLLSVIASAFLGASGPLGAPVGFDCLALEVGLSALPIALAWWLARRVGEAPAPRVLAAAGAGGALAAQAALEVTCHAVHTRAHLLVFHSGGVLAALLLGVIVARLLPEKILALRDNP